MIEFLLKHYSLLTHTLEFLAAVVGIIHYKKFQGTVTKHFIVFLIAIAFFDLFNKYTYYVRPEKVLSFLIGTKFEKNHWWSNLYWNVGGILFYAFYFFRVLKTKLFKRIIKHSAYIMLLFSITYIFLSWEQFFVQFSAVLNVFGALIIFMCSVLYFIEILVNDKILKFYKSIDFYISTVIFIWWLIITPLSFYDVYYTYEVGKNFFDLNFVSLRRQIYLFANIFMYSTFTFALIYCKPKPDDK